MANNQIPREITGVMGDTNKNIQFTGSSRTYKDGTTSYTPAQSAPKPEVSSAPAFPSITYAQKGVPDTASVFKIARYYMDNGEQDRAGKAISGYTQFMRTAGSPYYQPYYTSFTDDEKYESDTLEVEQALRDMYQDVRVAVAKGYSDAWIASNITSSKYKALKAADEAVTNGNPKKYTRQIPYLGADTVYGMIYQARNGDEYNSDIFSDVARYYMGYGKQYAPDDTEQAIRDRTSDKWNPYAFGGASASPTMNSLCGKYGVMGFTRDWAQKHADELEANGDRKEVFDIILATEEAEAEYKRLQETIAQRLRDGESVDDVYNLYFGNNMAYLKGGRKGDALDDGEEGYPTLFKMEHYRQQQGAIDLAWEVPFSSYGIKDWMAGEVEAMQREKEDAEYQTFYDAIPEDYRGAVLSLYARDKGLKKSEFSAEDLPEINAWIEEKGLAQQTDENVQGPVQSYGDRLYSFAQAQRAERAETVEPTPNFTASEFLSQINEQDKDGNKTMDAANANANFQLGLQDYYAGLPVDDPNVKAFVQKYAFLMGDTGKTVTRNGDPGSLISFDNTTSFENNRGSVLKGGRESTWLTEAEKVFGVDSPEWAQTLLTYANAYDQWVNSGASKNISFDTFVDQTPEVWEQIATAHEDIQAAKAKAEENAAAAKVETANKYNALMTRYNSGEQLTDYRDTYTWAKIETQDIRDAKDNDAGYKGALDSLSAYGAQFLQSGSATTGTDYWADNFRRNENEFICAEAGKHIDQLMKAAQAAGMSFDEYCKAVNIDIDTFAQSAYATAYTDYQEALDIGVQVAQAVGELSKDELKKIYKSANMRDKAEEWNQESLLRAMLDQGRITQQQYDDYKRLYDNNDADGDFLTGGDNLLRMAGSQVMGGKDRTLVEGEDRQSVAQELFNTQRSLRLDERKGYQKGVSGTSELVATGDSGNVATVLWNGVHNGTLTFADSWVVSAMGWLGRDRSEIEANARAKYSRDEYRGILENGIREKISNPELYEQYKRQLDNYTGDIYKFDFDNRTLGLQNAHANLNDQMQAIDEEMAAVLTPDAYQWYKYTSMAVNSIELSVPTMLISAVTHGAAVPTLITQLATTGVVEGGQTAYELQQSGVSAGASRSAGLMVGGLTALSEWGLDDLVTNMTYKSGVVKAIKGATDINAASHALELAKAVQSKTGNKGLVALAKYSGYALFGTAQAAINLGVGGVGESLQEVQQEATADLIKTQFGQRMKDADEYAQVFKDSFYSGLIQSAGTSIVGQVKRNVDTIRENDAITKKTINKMVGEALSVEGALAQRQAYFDENQRNLEALQNELNALYAEREAGQQILDDAESYARMMQDEANMSIDEALKLNTSELVQSIKQDQAESAELGNMLAEFERMIDEDNAILQMASEPVQNGNPTETELAQYHEAVGIVSDAQQKHDELAQRKAELDAKIAENQKTRKAQQEAIARQARAQAVEAETQRRVQAENERRAKRDAEIQKLENEYAQRIAEDTTLKDEIKALQKAYGNIAANGAASGQDMVEQTNAKYQAKRNYSPASIKAVQMAELMFKQFSGEDISAVAKRQALLKESLKHGLELSFPGYDISFERMGVGEDARVITEEDGTGKVVLNSDASIPALMSGIVQHEITHIAEAGGKYADLFQTATRAVYGDQAAVDRAMAAKEAELKAANPGISEDVTEPNNVYSQAQKEIVADAMANILGATNTAATEGQTGVYQIDWSKTLSKNNPLLANDIFEWLKIRSKELSKFAKATKDKAVKAQYNNFARVANLLYDCLQDVANKNTRSVEERGAFIGNPADYGIGESEEARTYAEREAPAASTTETATATDTAPATETAPQPKADETDEPVRTDEGYTTAPAQPEAQREQPAQMADETDEPVRTDTGFATVPQRTEQQSEQRASEPVAGITYAQREAPEATTAAVQTEEATTTQPEQTAQESPAEAPTARGESAEANEYAEREAPEESPYVEMLDEDEDTEVEQEEQEQEIAAPDTPAQGRPVASASEYVAALQQGEHAVLESGENIPMFALNENGEYQQTGENVSPEVQSVLDAVQDAGLEAEHNANVAESVEPEAIIQNLTAYQIKESMGQIIQGVKDAAFEAFSTSGLSASVNELMAHTENIKKYAKAILQTFSELSEADQEKLKPYTWQLEEMAENGFALETEETDAPQLKQNQTPQTEEEKALDEENPAQRIGVDLKKYKPYSNTHWDEFRYVCEYAKTVLTDLKNSLRGERLFHHNDTIGWTNTEVQGLTVYGQKRVTSGTIAAMLDEYKWSWAKISEVLNKFINAYETSTPLPNLNTIKRLETQLYYDLYHGQTGTVEGQASNEEQLYDGQKLSEAYLRKFAPENLTVDGDGNVIAIGENLTVVGDYLRNKAPYELSPEEREAQKREFAKAAQTSFIDYLTEYSRGFLARFNNSVLLNALQSQLEAARQSGDTAKYNRLAGRMLGIIRNIDFSARGTKGTSPIETLKRLADKIGTHIYEGVRMTTPGTDNEYLSYSRQILTNRANAISFANLLKSVADAVFDRASIGRFSTELSAGDINSVDIDGVTYTEPDMNSMFMNWMTHGDSITNNSPSLTEFVEHLKNAVLTSEDGQQFWQNIIDSRAEMVRHFEGEAMQRVASYMRSLDDKRMQERRGIAKWYQDFISKFVDTTIVADVVDKATNYTTHLRENAAYNNYGYGLASDLIGGKEGSNQFVNVDAVEVPGAKTLAQSIADAYDGAKLPGGKRETHDRIGLVLMIQSALDRIEAGQNPFTDSFEISGTDIGTLINPNEETLRRALDQLERADEHVMDAAQAVRDWFSNVVQTFAIDPGFLSAETYAGWQARSPHYAPLMRYDGTQGNDGGSEISGSVGSVKANGMGLQFKKARGHSDKTVINPIESMVAMTQTMVKKAVQNRTAQEFVRAYDMTPGLGWLAAEITPEQARTYKNNGEEVLAVYTPDMSAAETRLVSWGDSEGGEATEAAPTNTRYFLVNNSELFQLLSGSEKVHFNKAINWIGNFTRTMTKLTTGANPLFALKNAVRDFQHSVNYGSWATNYGTGAVKWLRALAEVGIYKFSKNINYLLRGENNGIASQQLQDFVNLGGEGWTRYGTNQNMNVRQLRNDIYGESAGKRLASAGLNFIEAGTLNEAIEMASRYAEYKYGQNETVDSEGATSESKHRAFMASREATVDFGRHGNSAAQYFIKNIIPFFNATLQGRYQEGRMFSEAERERLAPRLLKTAFNNLLMGAISVLACTKLGGGYDDNDEWKTAIDEYAQIADSMKREYLLLPLSALGVEGARDFIRIPLSHEVAARTFYELGRSSVENIMRAMHGESASVSDVGKDIFHAAWDAFVEPVTEGSFVWSPISQVRRNESWYGGNVISSSLEDQYWTNQYSTSTWGGFKTASQIVDYLFEKAGVDSDSWRRVGTPLGLEYIAQQYSGIIGQLLIPALSRDSSNGEKATPLSSIARVFTNSWTLDAEASTDIPNAYYDVLDRLNGIKEAGNGRKGLGVLASANLTDAEVTQAYEEARTLTSKGGALYDIKQQITDEWAAYNEIMSQTGVGRIEREEQAEPHRKRILELEQQGVNIGAEYYAKYGLDTGFFEGAVNSLSASGRTIAPLTNDERRAYAVSERYGDIMPEDYEDEVLRVIDATDNHSTTTVWANPPTSWTVKGTKYDPADYGAEDAVRDWYGDKYFELWNELMNNPNYAKATDEKKLKAIQNIHTQSGEYAKEQFLRQYVKPTLKGN